MDNRVFVLLEFLLCGLEPVSIVGRVAACSETAFSLLYFGYVGLPPKPA